MAVIATEGIEEEVGGRHARGVVAFPDEIWGEQQAAGIDAPLARLPSEIAHRLFARRPQPQHAFGDRPEDLGPGIEYVRRDLRGLVKGTEHHPSLGQAAGGARRWAVDER